MTREIGLIAFITAALACALAAAATHRRHPTHRTAWLIPAFAFALLALDIHLSFRFEITDFFRTIARNNDWYAHRRTFQAILLIILAPVTLTLIALWLRRIARLGRALTLAHLGLAGVAIVYLVEIISLHHVNRLLWTDVGPAMLIAWLWLLPAALTTTAALTQRPNRQ